MSTTPEPCSCGRVPGRHPRTAACCPCPCHTGGAVHVAMCSCYRAAARRREEVPAPGVGAAHGPRGGG